MKKIVLTGGGTAGHVTANVALIPYLRKLGFEIYYIGSHDGIEKNIIEGLGVKYYGISSGKLRRYVDLKNITDSFRVSKGVVDASKILRKLKPNLVFSKGGFVCVPVVIGAKLNRIPVVIHESDITPGLANKISMPFAQKICLSFPETLDFVNKKKGIITGAPIRDEVRLGDPKKGRRFCGFHNNKPVLLIMGGSLGSVKINEAARNILPKLTKKFQVVHICGKGNYDKSLENEKNYKQFEYLDSELPHIFAMSSIVVSRAGANSIYEFLTLKLPNLLIPLSKAASRGDQILNAASFEKQGFSIVLPEEDLSDVSLYKKILELELHKINYIEKMEQNSIVDGCKKVLDVICAYV